MIKNKIDGVVVVEGKTDKDKLIKLFDVNVITTNGSELSKETLELIKKISLNNKIILFLDPDYVGEQIRQKIINALPNITFYNCFINKSDIKEKKLKKGIAEANDDAIIKAFKNLISFNKNSSSLSQNEFNDLMINSKKTRIKICNHFKISYCNNKQLFKRLNMMNIDFKTIKKVIENE